MFWGLSKETGEDLARESASWISCLGVRVGVGMMMIVLLSTYYMPRNVIIITFIWVG